jgi:cyclase
MALAIRVIPCLDVADGRVVKGVNFKNLRDEGDPVELAARYYDEGADEVTFLDVTATVENRATMHDVVRRTAEQVFIPLTVGGGVRTVDDVARLLASGADKISINSAAIARPEVLTEIADRFGAQVTVLSLDIKRSPRGESGFVVTTRGGRTETDIDAIEWAQRAVDLGAGELLVNSIDADGTQDGFDRELIERLRGVVNAPIIASGGAGRVEHFVDAARAGADAVLAASVFHRRQIAIADVKQALGDAGFEVRRVPPREILEVA